MAKKVNAKKEKNKEDRGALFIPACLFLGMGFGFAIGKIVAGLLLGLGLGFLLFAIVNLVKKNK